MQSLGDGEFKEIGKSGEDTNGAKNQKRNDNDHKPNDCIGQCIFCLLQLLLVAARKKELKPTDHEHDKQGNPNKSGNRDDYIGKQWF